MANTDRLKCTKRGRLLSNKNKAAQLRFAKMDPTKTQDFFNNVLRTDEAEVKMPGHNALHSTNVSFQLHLEQNLEQNIWKTKESKCCKVQCIFVFVK